MMHYKDLYKLSFQALPYAIILGSLICCKASIVSLGILGEKQTLFGWFLFKRLVRMKKRESVGLPSWMGVLAHGDEA